MRSGPGVIRGSARLTTSVDDEVGVAHLGLELPRQASTPVQPVRGNVATTPHARTPGRGHVELGCPAMQLFGQTRAQAEVLDRCALAVSPQRAGPIVGVEAKLWPLQRCTSASGQVHPVRSKGTTAAVSVVAHANANDARRDKAGPRIRAKHPLPAQRPPPYAVCTVLGRQASQEVAMAVPSPAAPPRLRMMSSLDLDEHPTHLLRDHLFTLGMTVLFCAIVVLLNR